MTARCAYGCLEKFWGVLFFDSTATFPEIFNGLGPYAFVPIDEYECMTVRTKFEDRIALRVPEIIGGT